MANSEQSAESLFGAALDLPPERRAGFLDRECREAPELRRVVEELLEDNERLGSFIAKPIFAAGKETGTSDADGHRGMASKGGGERFHPEQIIASRFLVVRFIARGGMGEVYEVKDQFLQGARVALKIIRPEIAADVSNLHRFEREVILARKVVHPNLCPIYEIFRCEEPAPAFLFLTMKLLEGKTLEDRLGGAEGVISGAEALDICSQLLSGVAAMHGAGIVHRDLKPNNIMLERSRERLSVSIMDFGLARLYAAEASILTAGVIAGTPDYMAPELFLGQPPTEASDLFSLGVVLHRLFTGDRPVRSKTGVVSPAASLRLGQTPACIAEAVEGLLSADPAERCRAFANLHPDSQRGTVAREPARSRPRQWKWMSYASVGVVVAFAVAIWLTPAKVSGPLDSMQITSTEEAKQGPLFTDGARLYFNSRGTPAETAVVGGFSEPMHIFDPAFRLLDISADGSKALALRKDLNDETYRGTLWSESMLGGTPQKLSDHLAQFARWSPDGRSIVFADQQRLYRMDASGANLTKLWDAPRSIRDLSFSPDARRLSVSVYLGNLTGGHSRLWELQADGKNAHPLQFDRSSDMDQFGGQWTPDGSHFVFRSSSHDGRLHVYELVRPPWFEFWKKPAAVRITENQLDIQGLAPERDSKGLFILGRPDQGAMQALDLKTGKFVPYLDGLSAFNFVISPDRQWMAYSEYPSGYLWKSRLDGSERAQLTSSTASMQQWSPDGKWLTYTDWKNLYLVSADGGGPQNLSPKSDDGVVPVMPTWLPDGRSIAWSYYPFPDRPSTGIHVIELASRKVSVMPGSQGFYAPSWSPDGRYLIAIAQNPSRMVLYTAATKTWRDLHLFDVEWGLWIWSTDSKSIYMDLLRKGTTGIFRLTIPEGAWSRVSGLDGVTTEDGATPPSLTPDGRPALMSHTGVVQVYSLSWKPD